MQCFGDAAGRLQESGKDNQGFIFKKLIIIVISCELFYYYDRCILQCLMQQRMLGLIRKKKQGAKLRDIGFIFLYEKYQQSTENKIKMFSDDD